MADKVVFHIDTATWSVKDFETLAEQVSPLKKHGSIEMMVCSQAEPTRADMPPGGSSWHDYASYLPTWQKFFPHPKMVPFLDMAHVERNRALMAGCVKALRKHGYTAGFSLHTPYFMPEEFFAKYPHLRGARCDHPRRTRREAFALCVDHPESLAMYREMAEQAIKDIPELTWIRMVANDAGSGLCWADWIYPGPNGASACKHIPTAQRVHKLADTVRAGFGDKRVDICLMGNYSPAEMREMETKEGELLHTQKEFHHRGHPYQLELGNGGDNPVRGIMDPVAWTRNLGRMRDPIVKRVRVNFWCNYARGYELEDVQELTIGFVDAFFKESGGGVFGAFDRMAFLRKMCGTWVGEKKRDDLLEALVELNEAYLYRKGLATAFFNANYGGVSMRAIDRPLVIMPEKLTPEEESYFLPHVFNPNLQEARVDYLDWHGGKVGGGVLNEVEANGNPRVVPMDHFCDRIRKVAGALDGMGGTPAGDSFARMAISLRLYACIMRSINNMFCMGTLRDRNMAKLGGPAHIPPKIGDWIGDPDLQLMNGFMRDELDNAAEMIRLLENGGKRQMLLADCAEDEDTFLLGPNLVDNLKKKSAIMRRHWLDAEAYMSTPHK